MLTLESPCLTFREVTADDLPALLPVYLSNPDFVAMNEGSRGTSGYFDLEMFRRDWWVQRMMPGSHWLGIYLTSSGEAVGQANFLEENPDDGYPWLGLLMIAADHQGRGLGREAFERLAEHSRVEYGWAALRLGVRPANVAALGFWEHLGFEVVERRARAIILQRALDVAS
jgi:RimJ/RimL family protein N-acetyltransferase